MEILFVVLFGYLRRLQLERLQKVSGAAASKTKEIIAFDQAKQAIPVLIK